MTETSVRLPAEWARQSAVLLTWPHLHGDWRRWLDQVEPVFVAITREVATREQVMIACYDEGHRSHIAGLLQTAGVPAERARLYIAPSNDTWARDHGPITALRNGRPVLLDFRFNGWGRKYAHDLDDQVTARLHAAGAFGETPLEPVDLILEGGSIESDGEGTLLTTSRCLLSPERNPQYDCADLESFFRRHLGIERVLWLRKGYLEGDDTDSHVDTLARLCDRRTIAYVSCDDPADPHYEELKEMEGELQAFRTADGEPYRLVPLPWPSAKRNEDGDRLPATYANFLIINDAVLVPVYDDPADTIALRRLADCFPEREIVAIDGLPLIRQYGSLHCVTMQLPEGVVG